MDLERPKRVLSEETRKMLSEKARARWSNPEFRDKVIAKIQSKENKDIISKTTKERWKNQEYRLRVSNLNSLAAIEQHKRMSKEEKELRKMKLLDANKIHRQKGIKIGHHAKHNDATKRHLADVWKNKFLSGYSVWNKDKNGVQIVSNETRQKLREIRFKKLSECGISYPCVGNQEKETLDKIELERGIKIKRQHYIIGYFLDGYVPELNLAIEVDESHHFDKNGSYSQHDVLRQKEIEEALKCSFERIKV
jgi:hypothetical protein